MVKNNQTNSFNNNLTNLDRITINGEASSNNEVSNKKDVDDSIREGTVVRVNQILHKFLKVSLGKTFLIRLNMIEYKLQMQQLLKLVSAVEILFPI